MHKDNKKIQNCKYYTAAAAIVTILAGVPVVVNIACTYHTLSAVAIKLILFPSHVTHFVESNMHDTPRISLSMNTFIKGSIGIKDSLTEVIFK